MSVTVYTPKRNPYADSHSLAEWDVCDSWDAGQTLLEMFPGIELSARIDGHEVPAELLTRARLKDGVTVWVRPIPQGSAAKWLLPALEVAAAIVIQFVPGVNVAVDTYLGVGAAALLATSLAFSGGIGLIGAALAPSVPSLSGSAAQQSALTGESNQIAKFTPIPRLLGRMRYFPPVPMTAKPYTEMNGTDQHLRYKLLLGYGPLSIGGTVVDADTVLTEASTLTDEISGQPTIQIGSADIHNYDDVEWDIYGLGAGGAVPAGARGLYTDQVDEVGLAWTTNAHHGGNGGSDGDVFLQTTSAGATGFSLDVVGLIYSTNDHGDARGVTVQFSVQWRAAGTSTWTGTDSFAMSVQQGQPMPRYQTWRKAGLPATSLGYDVQLTRVATHFDEDHGPRKSTVIWTVLRSYLPRQAWAVPGTVVMDLRIRATDQLNGQVDQLSVLATSVLDVYDAQTQTWTPQATRSPAWAFASVLCDAANGKPLDHSALNADSLAAWAAQTDGDGVFYDAVLDNAATTLERMQAITAAGYAMYSVDGALKIRTITDPVFGDQTPRDVVSPRTMSGYSVSLAAFAPPDALRVQYTSPDSWQKTERIVYWDGFDATSANNYLSVQAPGCANDDQAFIFGRRYLGNLRLRAIEIHQYGVNYRYFDYGVGDVVHLAHRAIMVGLSWGRVQSVATDVNGNVTSITVDDIMLMPDPNTAYGAKLQRGADGTVVVFAIQNDAPSSATITPTEDVTDIAVDDLILVGEVGKITTAVMVTKIEPQDGHSATITAVPLAPALADAATGPIPPPANDVTLPPDPSVARPNPPTIVSIDSSADAALLNDDGSKQWQLVVSIAFGSSRGSYERGVVQARVHGSGAPWLNAKVEDGTATFHQFGPSDVVDVRAQVIGKNGLHSIWVETDSHQMDDRLPWPATSIVFIAGDTAAIVTPVEADYPEQTYEIWRSDAEQNLTVDFTATSTRIGIGKSVTDTGLAEQTTYWYQVRATNKYGTSDWYQDSVATSLSAYVTAVEYDQLKSQVDGQIDSYFFAEDVGGANDPSTGWTDDAAKIAHLGDTFTNISADPASASNHPGQSWRWVQISNVYQWQVITDTATTQALALAGQAQDTADSKRRVFTAQPTTPYDAGDLWTQVDPVTSTESIWRAGTARTASQSFTQADWTKVGDVTQDNTAKDIIGQGPWATKQENQVNLSEFPDGTTPIGIVHTGNSLPNPTGYTGVSTVYNENDGKLYRYVDGAWTAAIAAGDLTGTLDISGPTIINAGDLATEDAASIDTQITETVLVTLVTDTGAIIVTNLGQGLESGTDQSSFSRVNRTALSNHDVDFSASGVINKTAEWMSFTDPNTHVTDTIKNVLVAHKADIDANGDGLADVNIKWGVLIDNNKRITGIGLNSGADSTTFEVIADKFAVYDPNTSQIMVGWDGTKFVVNGELVVGDITGQAGSIANQGALATQSSVSYGSVTGTKPPTNATYGAVAGVNLRKNAGSLLNDADVITSEGTALNTTNVGSVAASHVAGWGYSLDTTKIDGGTIQTGTVAAAAITAHSITSDQIEAGKIVAASLDATTVSAYTMSYGLTGPADTTNSGYWMGVDSGNGKLSVRGTNGGFTFSGDEFKLQGTIRFNDETNQYVALNDHTLNGPIWSVIKNTTYSSYPIAGEFFNETAVGLAIEAGGGLYAAHIVPHSSTSGGAILLGTGSGSGSGLTGAPTHTAAWGTVLVRASGTSMGCEMYMQVGGYGGTGSTWKKFAFA